MNGSDTAPGGSSDQHRSRPSLPARREPQNGAAHSGRGTAPQNFQMAWKELSVDADIAELATRLAQSPPPPQKPQPMSLDPPPASCASTSHHPSSISPSPALSGAERAAGPTGTHARKPRAKSASQITGYLVGPDAGSQARPARAGEPSGRGSDEPPLETGNGAPKGFNFTKSLRGMADAPAANRTGPAPAPGTDAASAADAARQAGVVAQHRALFAPKNASGSPAPPQPQITLELMPGPVPDGWASNVDVEPGIGMESIEAAAAKRAGLEFRYPARRKLVDFYPDWTAADSWPYYEAVNAFKPPSADQVKRPSAYFWGIASVAVGLPLTRRHA